MKVEFELLSNAECFETNAHCDEWFVLWHINVGSYCWHVSQQTNFPGFPLWRFLLWDTVSTILEKCWQGLTKLLWACSLSPQCDSLVTFSIKAQAIFSNHAVQCGLSLARFRDMWSSERCGSKHKENCIQRQMVIVNNYLTLPDTHQSSPFFGGVLQLAWRKLQLRLPHGWLHRCELMWNREEEFELGFSM